MKLSSLIDRYDVFFIDLWGVTHNGQKLFSGALKAYENIKTAGKSSFILSNAPRMPDAAIQRLNQMGLSRDLYCDLYTSGYECHNHLKDRPDTFYQSLGTRLYHMGPERDRNLFDTLDYTPVHDIRDADFLLVTGTDTWNRTLESYQDDLDQALKRGLPLVCANPDKRVLYGDQLVLCSGAIASRYQEMGGQMRKHGKPDPATYGSLHNQVQNLLGKDVHKDRLLMIGDSLATDIRGANAYGIDSLMVLTGLHGSELLPHFSSNAEQFSEALDKLVVDYGSKPTYVVERLAW